MLRVVFIPTWRCNIASLGKCPYCDYTPSSLTNTVDLLQGLTEYTLEEHSGKEWLKFFSTLPPALIDFTGGEPMVHPDIIEILKKLPKKHGWAMTSNTTLKVDEVIEEVGPERCACWTASFHYLAPKPYCEPDWFLNQIIKLKNAGFNVAVNIVGYPTMLHVLDVYIPYFRKHGFPVNVLPFLNRHWNWHECPKLKEKLLKYKDYFAGNQKLKWDLESAKYTKICSAGKDYFIVIADGQAFRCYSTMIYNDRRAYLGNVFDGTFKLLKEDKICKAACLIPCDYNRAKIIGKKI